MYPIRFDKQVAAEILQNIATGQPIRPPDGQNWKLFDLLMLAGVAFSALVSHGPERAWRGMPKEHPEREEAHEETFFADLHASIGFVGQLAMDVHDDKYDHSFGPEVVAVMNGETRQVTPVKGFKGHEDKL